MTTPAIPDSSDRVIELSKAKRLHGATVEEWIALVEKNPDRTLPGGVGGAIVVFMKGQLVAAYRDTVTLANELKRIEQASGAPDPFAIADHVLDKMIELHAARAELDRLTAPGKVTVDLLVGPNARTVSEPRLHRTVTIAAPNE